MSKVRDQGREEKSRRGKGRVVQQEWQLHEAKARFSEVFRLAREAAPSASQNMAVRLSSSSLPRNTLGLRDPRHAREALPIFFAASPLRGSGIDLERPRDFGREIKL